jgi:hypothetical protein
MNKFLTNLVCAFIPIKSIRDNIRRKYAKSPLQEIKDVLETLSQKIETELTTLSREIKMQSRRISYPIFHNIDYMNIDFMNSIIFDFSGGLGDQLFSFLYAYKVFKEYKNDNNYKFYFNINDCNDEQGGFKLLSFDIRKYINFETVKLPREIIKIYSDTKSYSCSYSFDKKLFTNNNINRHIVDNTNAIEAPIIIKRKVGFSDNYNKYPDDIRNMLTLIAPMDEANKNKLEKIKNCDNPICIHLRRGDVIRNKNKGYAVNKNYVNRSIREMINKLKERDSKINEFNFFIFSNGIEWARENLDFNIENIDKNITVNSDFVDINDDTKSEFELELMKNCKHYIISGGGFSVLPLFLNTYPDKIVIEPGDDDWEY